MLLKLLYCRDASSISTKTMMIATYKLWLSPCKMASSILPATATTRLGSNSFKESKLVKSIPRSMKKAVTAFQRLVNRAW